MSTRRSHDVNRITGTHRLWRALGEVFPETREQRCWVHSVPRGRARSAGEEVRLVA
jgi:transposase-like protein